MKIALGTAQLGMHYGVNNRRGKIPAGEAYQILDLGFQNGVDMLDTAPAYGASESVIGDFIKKYGIKFDVISKLPQCRPGDEEMTLHRTLKFLNLDRLYGYLLHSFQAYQNNPGLWDLMSNFKKQGHTKKIGFSLYFPSELEILLRSKVPFDILQVPYSVFDRRFERYFDKLKEMDIEVHARSIFLQGLVFKKLDELQRHFSKITEKLKKLQRLSRKEQIPVAALCLNFVISYENIDKVVVGVDNIDNFRQILKGSTDFPLPDVIRDKLVEFREEDENILLPFKWQEDPTGE